MDREKLARIPYNKRRNYDQKLSRWVPERKQLTLSEAHQVLPEELYSPNKDYSCFETMRYFGFQTIFDLVIYIPKEMYLGVDDRPLKIAPHGDCDKVVRAMNLGLPPYRTKVLWGRFIKREAIAEPDNSHFKTTIDYMASLGGFVPTWPNQANAILLYCWELEAIDRRFCQPDRSQLLFTTLGDDLKSPSGKGIVVVSTHFINRYFKASIDNIGDEKDQTTDKKSYTRVDYEYEPIVLAASRAESEFREMLERIALERESKYIY